MKTHPNFPNYVITDTGAIFSTINGEEAARIKGEYKVLTAETFTDRHGKKHQLIRRFTPAQLVKVYNSPEAVEYKQQEPETKPEPDTKTEKKEAPVKTAKGVEIEGVKYSSAGKAAKALGVSIPTITRRCKSSDFPNYKVLE